jgi:hypothetical protein
MILENTEPGFDETITSSDQCSTLPVDHSGGIVTVLRAHQLAVLTTQANTCEPILFCGQV